MDIKQKVENLIKNAIKSEFSEDFSENIHIEHPKDFSNGDYTCTSMMKIFASFRKQIKDEILEDKKASGIILNSQEFIQKIISYINKNLPKEISKVETKNSFINFYLSREFFSESINEILDKKEDWGKNENLANKKIMVEYTQPNPFKPFHIGHLMSNTIGESISRIVQFGGAKTIRANYQGDVGPHVAKAIYIMMKNETEINSLRARPAPVSEIAQYIGECYSQGSNLYDTDENIKKEIDEINKKIYEKSDHKINEIYDWGREVTLEAFEEIYKLLGTKFDYYFFESEVSQTGEKIVKENMPAVFEESDGAIVFHAEKYNSKLHTRVFINSKGLPTYETKEIGLTMTKFGKENPDLSIITTAIEQAEYMKVVACAVSIIHPELGSRMKHVTHGMMRLASGKMSSRKGNVVTGESLLRDSMNIILDKVKDRDLADDEKKKISEVVGVSALKYSILKSALGGDIVYDFEKSISFEGDSGPYLQYTAVRANSILEKAKEIFKDGPFGSHLKDRPLEISDLERLLYQFPETVERAYDLFEPHHIATYLTQLASAFNNFYGNTKILDEENKYIDYHLNLVKAFYQTMKNGLWLLGIEIPERM